MSRKPDRIIRVSDGEGHWVHIYACCRYSYDHGHGPDCPIHKYEDPKSEQTATWKATIK